MFMTCLVVLRNAKDVPVRILEPGDFGSARRVPDSEIVLLHAREPLEMHSGGCQSLRRKHYVCNFPAENGISGRVHLVDDGDAQHGPMSVVHERKWLLFLNQP